MHAKKIAHAHVLRRWPAVTRRGCVKVCLPSASVPTVKSPRERVLNNICARQILCPCVLALREFFNKECSFRSLAIRLLWVATCFAGLLGAGWLIWSIWLRYATSPTVMMVQDTSYPLYHIPFPAVTVCSVNKVLKSEALKFVTE